LLKNRLRRGKFNDAIAYTTYSEKKEGRVGPNLSRNYLISKTEEVYFRVEKD